MNYIPAITSAMAFYAIPILVGLGVLAFSKRNAPTLKITVSGLTNSLVTSFIYGSIILYGLALAAHYLSSGPPAISRFINLWILFIQAVFAVAALAVALYTFKSIKIQRKLEIKFTELIILPLILLIAGTVYTLWRWDSNTTTTLNWDIYHHQTMIVLIQKNHFDLLPSKLSDSFQFTGYSTMFHTLLALPQILFKPDILEFWWFIEFFHLAAVVLISYTLAHAVTQSKTLGLLGALLGGLVFESSVAYTSLFLIPQNLAAVMTVAFITIQIQRYENDTKKHLITPSLVAFLIYIMLNHLIIGVLGTFLLAFSITYLQLKKLKSGVKIENILLTISFLLLLVVPLVATQFDLDAINRGEAAFFNYTLDKKWTLAKDFCGYMLPILLPLGIVYALKQKKSAYKLLIILNNGILALVIASIPYSLKFYTIGRFMTTTLMALGFWFLIEKLPSILKGVCTAALIIALEVILIVNFSDFKQVPSYKEVSTHVTPNELETARFLRSRYENSDVLLISDPATMHILEGLSEINTPGGAYTSRQTRTILSNIYYSRDSQNMTKEIFGISDLVTKKPPQKVLFAITGRFTRWQLLPDERKYGIFWNVWEPMDLTAKDYEFVEFLTDTMEYKEVFRNEGVILFEIPKPNLF